ncbi:MurR/RpiR family transcriptional regulator [Ruania alba]|uniref:DNA-binding transcriptional regulator, MurR/RpiR family, contains HTH and SIS domains n=1 Tax=Ruania alba TaxID=648782 RepID=A0A1H5M1E0_9MICO|nr:MurR/RpiR family transcriptional regulator [Ruania alba]SEE82567.1 DNA-binding transcriptional regulator, MurR/RpiR family, contains HTH and SIS domains [Ruania alba]
MPTQVEQSTRDVPIAEVIRSQLPRLTPTVRAVGEAILADPDRVLAMSAARLADTTGTSVGSVVRLCHAIGLPGYLDFKQRLAADARIGGYDLDAVIDPYRSRSVAGQVLGNVLSAMAQTLVSIDLVAVQRAADAIRGGRRILIPAAGPSQPVATAFGMWLSWAGFSATHPTDRHTQQAVAEQLTTEDVVFAISHSGTTKDTLRPVHIARERGITTLALTSFAGSDLARLCDITIVAGAAADEHRTADMASRPVHHAVLEAVWAQVRTPTPTETA